MSSYKMGDSVRSVATRNVGRITARWRHGSTYQYEVTYPRIPGDRKAGDDAYRYGSFPTAHDAGELEPAPREELEELEEKRDANTDTAIDWLLAVRKYGLEKANAMFPPELEEEA